MSSTGSSRSGTQTINRHSNNSWFGNITRDPIGSIMLAARTTLDVATLFVRTLINPDALDNDMQAAAVSGTSGTPHSFSAFRGSGNRLG